MSRSATPRREFLTQLAAATTAAALTGIARSADAAESLAALPTSFDDSWARRVKHAKHKAVFDSPEANDGLGLYQAWIYRAGYREALGDTGDDVVPVVVLRHQNAVLGVDDALWAKYGIGAIRKIDDPETKKPAERNPWARTKAGDKSNEAATAVLGMPIDPTVEGVLKAGGVVLVCNLALRNSAGVIAKERKLERDAVHAELLAGLVPGAIVQPSGIYATARAQEMGAVFMRST